MLAQRCVPLRTKPDRKLWDRPRAHSAPRALSLAAPSPAHPTMPRSGPPAHPNKEAFVPSRGDKHNSLQKAIKALPRDGCCRKCNEVIEWKKQYGKYKPLKQPAKCTGCQQRSVMLAYHQLCPACTAARKVCPKCMTSKEADDEEDSAAATQPPSKVEKAAAPEASAAPPSSVDEPGAAQDAAAPAFRPGSFRTK